jgi:uncharacterized Zn-binding protein involved in type VI secretion
LDNQEEIMPNPAARIGDSSATGDTIVGPGNPTVQIGGMPAAVMGDSIAGSVCTGSIIDGSPTVQIGGMPAARISSNCTGVSSGGSASSTVLAQGDPTVTIP